MTTSITDLYERIRRGVDLGSEDAGIRFTTTLSPSGGPGTRLMPPTYPGGYIRTKRHVGRDEPVDTVLIDSYQSEANRVEQALLDARDAGQIDLPLFELRMQVDNWPVRLTSLDFPHRYADAYLKDSSIGGTRFDKTEIGAALRVATPGNAGPLFRHDPVSLVLGAWNSHRKGRQPKFSRAYRSEVIGIGEVPDARRGGRLDPLNLTGATAPGKDDDWEFVATTDKKKGAKLSEIGHGNALSGDDAPGGVTVEEVRRLGFLSFATLSRLRFTELDPGDQATARAALAALALVGDRLAFGTPGWVFRSGCELTVLTDEIGWERRGGEVEPLALDVTGGLDLFAYAVEAAASAGLPMDTSVHELEPTDGLRKAIEHAFLAAAADEG